MSETATSPAPQMRGLTFSDEGRADHWYRFSVRCDRADNARLEAMARRSGVSVTTFVQRHFETLLSPPKIATEPTVSADFDVADFARRHELTLPAARVYGALLAMAGADGTAVAKLEPLAQTANVGATSITKLVDRLEDLALIERLRSGGTKGTTYLVRRDFP